MTTVKETLHKACSFSPSELSWKGLVDDHEWIDENYPLRVKFEVPVDKEKDALLALPEREPIRRGKIS